ncbi:radical SAM protein [Candidatus Omnitrophota bacterium]
MKVLHFYAMNDKIKEAYKLMESCLLCPRECGVNRLKGEVGFCKGGLLPMVSSFHAHFGEEPPISGLKGSGTIFFTHCSLKCAFCQNHPISHLGQGREVSIKELADMMLKLQGQGCHNINFVTPTHYMPQILEAVFLAKAKGLKVPLVYNSGGYESLGALKLLDGIIDIYMPDVKYSDDNAAKKYSSAPDYFEIAKKAVKEMYSQVGDLKIEKGLAKKGLLIRHLVLPDGLAGSEAIFNFIVKDLSPDTYVNIMAQYYPCHKASSFSEIKRRITRKEYTDVLKLARKKHLSDGFKQVLATIERVRIPEWTDDLKEGRL